MVFLFWVSIFFLVYTYVLYPLIIYVWGALFPKRVEKRYRSAALSVVLAVHNEEDNIVERLRNLQLQDYPRDLVEIIVVSDGSSDFTVELARSIEDPRIRVLETERHGGKASAINVGAQMAKHPIIVFADARQRFSENTFAELTALFHDSRVGAVTGELIIRRRSESGDVAEGVGLYWRYEKLLRRMESKVDSVVGSTGCIYAIRRELFVPIPPDTILDDFLVPMRVVLQGYRVIFSRPAKAYDRPSETAADEFRRKVRTLAGNFQALAFEKALLNPLRNRIYFQMVSHKITQLIAPYFVVTALVSNLFLPGVFFHATLALQLLFYVAVLLRFTPLIAAPFGGILRVAWTFAVLNAAAVMGLWVFASGRDRLIWKKGRI